MSVDQFIASFGDILPLTFLFAFACALLVVDLFIPKGRKATTAVLAALGLVITLVLLVIRWDEPVIAFGGMVVVDRFASYLNILLVISGLLGIAVAHD